MSLATIDSSSVERFVRCSSNDLGVGKLRALYPTSATVEYFVGPGCPTRTEVVPRAAVTSVSLPCETRVYTPLADGVSWRAGRAVHEVGDAYYVRFPNSRDPEPVPTLELFTRCELPLPEPSVFLAARITETPHWHERRARFVRAVVEQRGYCAGLTALLASAIDLEPHQVEVVRRVLQDPIQRYLLADEVGLGKTIEVGWWSGSTSSTTRPTTPPRSWSRRT
ncbi:MAG: hypothetical protein U0792_05385 [Gemmataceae bacterium]